MNIYEQRAPGTIMISLPTGVPLCFHLPWNLCVNEPFVSMDYREGVIFLDNNFAEKNFT